MAVELLGGVQLFIRLSVLVFCIVCGFLVGLRFSLQSVTLLAFFLIYMFLVYLLNGGSLALNFIYLAVMLFYFYSLGVGRRELLVSSCVASFLVIFLYLIYWIASGANLDPVAIDGRVRYYFGFTNPNKVGIVAYSLVVLSALCFLGRSSFWFFAICVPVFVVAIYSDSRTSLYALTMFAGLACLPFLVYFKKLLFVVPGILLAGSFYIASLSDSGFANELLSNRPIDFHEFLSGLSFYDFVIGANSDGYRVDNSYILAYFAVGPLGFLLFLCSFVRFGSVSLGTLELAFLVSMMAYGLMEGVLVRVEFPAVIYFYYLIFGREEGTGSGVAVNV